MLLKFINCTCSSAYLFSSAGLSLLRAPQISQGDNIFLAFFTDFPTAYSGKHGLLKRGTGNEREAARTGDDENKHKA